jgi:hypothetical protein
MAQEPPKTNSDKRHPKASERSMGEPVRQRISKQAATESRQVEAAEQDLPRNCERDGKPMERIRIWFWNDFPECECCGEPFCEHHAMHYGDCSCLGPDNAEEQGWELEEYSDDGTLYAIRPLPTRGCLDSDDGSCKEIGNTTNQ